MIGPLSLQLTASQWLDVKMKSSEVRQQPDNPGYSSMSPGQLISDKPGSYQKKGLGESNRNH